MTRRHALASLGALALMLQPGCWFGTASTSDVRTAVSAATGWRLEPEFGIKLGRISTAFAKVGVRMAADQPIPLRGVHKAEVGIYSIQPARAEAGPGPAGDLVLPGWETVVRIRDGRERVQVLVQAEAEKIRAMLVLAVDAEELVVVRVRGKLHEFLAAVLEATDRPPIVPASAIRGTRVTEG